MSRGPPNIDGMVSLKVDNLSYRIGYETISNKLVSPGKPDWAVFYPKKNLNRYLEKKV